MFLQGASIYQLQKRGFSVRCPCWFGTVWQHLRHSYWTSNKMQCLRKTKGTRFLNYFSVSPLFTLYHFSSFLGKQQYCPKFLLVAKRIINKKEKNPSRIVFFLIVSVQIILCSQHINTQLVYALCCCSISLCPFISVSLCFWVIILSLMLSVRWKAENSYSAE